MAKMKIGTNLGPLDESFGTERPFLNELKQTAGYYTYTAAGGSDTGEEVKLYQTALDSNGYCTSFSGFTFGALLMQLNLSEQSSNPIGKWVFLCDLNGGTPTFNFTSNCCFGNVDSSNAASGRWVMDNITLGNTQPIKIWQTATGTPHATNFRLIFAGVENPGDVASGAGTGVGTVVGVNGVGTREALYNSNVIAGQTWGGFNPTFLTKTAPYKSIRFMNWGATEANAFVNWSDRRTVGWVFYNDGASATKLYGTFPGSDLGGTADGVPYEVMCTLCNTINADMHICMPSLSTDDYVTQLATLVHTNLNAPLKVRVEYSNELWNQSQYQSGSIGTITASATSGVMTVSSVSGMGGKPLVTGTPGAFTGHYIDDAGSAGNVSGTFPVSIQSFVSGISGGVGVYNLTRSALSFTSRTLNVGVNVLVSISELNLENAPPYLGSSNSQLNTAYSAVRASQVGNMWKNIWGADASRVIRLFGGWCGNNGYNVLFLPLTFTASTSLAAATYTGTISGGTTLTVSGVSGTITPHSLVTGGGVASQTYIQSGSGTTWTIYPSQGNTSGSMTSAGWFGTVASNVDEVCVAPYFSAFDFDRNAWSDMPYAWLNYSASVASGFVAAAIQTGGTIPLNGGGRTIHSGDGGNNFTLTSGLSLSGTPPALTMVSGTFDTTVQAGAHIVVDSCTSFPILSRQAAYPGSASGGGLVGNGYELALCFDNVAGGWSLLSPYDNSGWYQIDNANGNGNNVVIWITANAATAATNSVGLCCYEGGQQFETDHRNGSGMDGIWINFYRDHASYTVYTEFLNNMNNNATISVFHHFYDIGPMDGTYWGASEYVTQTPNSPKYQALLDFMGIPNPSVILMPQACM